MNRRTRFFVLPLAAFLICETALAGVIKGKVQCKGMKNSGDAVVYLESVAGQFPAPKQTLEMDQLKRTFVPHVLPVMVGTTVSFLNSDPVLHNVFTPSKAGNRFNLGSYPKGQTKTQTFDKVGEIRILCNVHPEMEAWVLVLPNPYFAKTAPDGTYSIGDVPAGKYVLKVWHEKLKFAPAEIVVPAKGDAIGNLAAQ